MKSEYTSNQAKTWFVPGIAAYLTFRSNVYIVDGFTFFTDIVKYGGGPECKLYKLKTHSIEMYGKSYVDTSCNSDTAGD